MQECTYLQDTVTAWKRHVSHAASNQPSDSDTKFICLESIVESEVQVRWTRQVQYLAVIAQLPFMKLCQMNRQFACYMIYMLCYLAVILWWHKKKFAVANIDKPSQYGRVASL